ncbi:MAG: universal stress protein [Chloroflexi bacterium]|nr:universal stress protein [Chloroflexota bacterium]
MAHSHQRYHRILVPLDGSGWAKRAVPHAADLARANDAELILLHVFKTAASEFIDQVALAGQDAQIDAARQQMKQYLMGLRSELREEGLNVRVQWIEGSSVAHLICDYINAEGVDLVVMSTHGGTGLRRFLFGSVTNQVMQGIKAPVLLIRPDESEGA